MVLSGKAKKIVQTKVHQITKELLQELAIALLEEKEDGKPKDLSLSPWDRRCKYHFHNPGDPLCLKSRPPSDLLTLNANVADANPLTVKFMRWTGWLA